MKLCSSVLAALVGINGQFQLSKYTVYFTNILDASVTCPNGASLFEVSCTISEGFDIRINESCRKTYFPFIDFTNSFVWGEFSSTLVLSVKLFLA